MRLNKKRCAAVAVVAAMAAGGGLAAGIALASDKPSCQHVDNNKMFSVAAVHDAEVGKMILTAAEREMVERVVAAEARGESFEGQAAVAEVIYNRCMNRGQSVEQVIWTDKQFAHPYGGEISQDTKEAVAAVFDYELLNLDGAEYFHADYVLPSWAEDMEEVCRIGNHIFYKGVQ
jgi:spore germination cell wall hydrolase CwlJ-like protein